MDENEKLISKSNLGIVLDAMKAKFDEVPDSLADLSQDSDHQTVTSDQKDKLDSLTVITPDEKTADMTTPVGVDADGKLWTEASGKVTSVNGEIGDVVLDIPDSLADLSGDATHRTVTDSEKSTWNAKQAALVSGQNIKTVNGQSILGSGDLPAGLVDDIKQNGTSIVANKIANIVLETSLGSDSNNAATTTAVRAFVNSSINSLAAFYVTADASGNAFATKAALTTGPWYYAGSTRTPTQNDYAIVTADETHDGATARYLYTGAQWSFQYTFGVTFTQAQIDAMNSGITSALRQAYDAHLANTDIHVTSAEKSSWSSKQDTITDLDTIRSGAALGETALQSVPNTYRTAAAQDLIDGAQDEAIQAKYSKPSTGIPASDLAEGVVPDTDEVDELEIDTVPTANSANLITSGGVKAAIDAIETVTGFTAAEIDALWDADEGGVE